MKIKKNKDLYWFFRSAALSSVFLACALLLLVGFSAVYENMQKIAFNKTITVLSFTDSTVNIYGFTVDLLPLRNMFIATEEWIINFVNQIISIFY